MLILATSADAARATTRGPRNPSNIGADPLGHLPEAARLKLRSIRDQDDEDAAAIRDLGDRIAEQRDLAGQFQRRIRELTDPDRHGISGHDIVPRDHPSVVTAQGAFDHHTVELARLTARRDALQARRSRCAVRCLRYIETLPHGEPIAEHTEPVRVPKGATVDGMRTNIGELRAEYEAIQRRPAHSEAIREMLARQVRDLAARGEPDVLRSIELGRPLSLPAYRVTDILNGFAQVGATQPPVRVITHFDVPDAIPILFWLAEDVILKKLNEMVDSLADDSRALTEEQRAGELARIEAAIIDAERVEEELVVSTGARRRDDADPRAVLGLGGDLPLPG
jgi:hypothetical protein